MIEYFIFESRYFFLGSQNGIFKFFEIFGYVTFAIAQGLLSDIFFRRQAQVGFCDFNIISENLVVTDFQVADAGFFFFARLQFGDVSFGVVHDLPEPVHIRIKTVFYDAAFPNRKGRFIGYGPVDQTIDLGDILTPRH
ncbi:hypothetical protein SDC9_109124 [bioreactor metagenome]|uniref:Uncharacterized protein n=1 Tax=bioreactor metagenome TaxID=1076179 RepID=A0A645BB31_9ZZZZ